MRFDFKIKITSVILLVLIIMASNRSFSQEIREVANLKGDWKFSIGDNSEWSKKDLNDQHWDEIGVPGSWENQGFHGYDGYAWYRTYFRIEERYLDMPVYLSLGYIDDVDEVYVNGEFIGVTGSFPNDYATAFNSKRFYRIPKHILHSDGKNTIAVRIYDEGGEGGIIHGDIAIMVDFDAMPVEYDLQGKWHFKTSNCDILSNEQMDFSYWDKIMVPGMWENQGYKHFDGIACYAIEFDLNNEFENERMVLVLGKIDDLDQVYLNGKLIGQSGDFDKKTLYNNRYYDKQLRGYYLPLDALNHQAKNVLVVKVLDAGGLGGLYEGSVGLISQKNYIKYWKARRKR